MAQISEALKDIIEFLDFIKGLKGTLLRAKPYIGEGAAQEVKNTKNRPERKLDPTGFATAATSDATWVIRGRSGGNQLRCGQPLSDEDTPHVNTGSTYVKVAVKEVRKNCVHRSSHTPARTAQKLASSVKTYFEDWVDKNERYLPVCNLALIPIPEKQWKLHRLTGEGRELLTVSTRYPKCRVTDPMRPVKTLSARRRDSNHSLSCWATACERGTKQRLKVERKKLTLFAAARARGDDEARG
ncbi:hypothetical protein EVAR_47998_1 [Eumeta japonica]|uniref:Uncharacterized protein n=1 Tax=Eumeta variegata TaxID=151549 RepID=A0A4C1XN66_EUMVA|nr:hypothetical protein EVAR_47998_1 [Eumeta japonica]